MSTEFFEIFIRTEICRHPSLGSALQLKSNLRRCSIQFESAFAELHHRLIKAAVQLLFSQVSAARLHELSSRASSSCETKYVITDSSQRGSPNSHSSQATEVEQCSSRWDAQSNNSQGVHAVPRSPSRRNNRGSSGSQPSKLHKQSSNRWTNAVSGARPKNARQQSPSCQQPQQVSQAQQQQQRPKCEPQQMHLYAKCQQQPQVKHQQAHSFAQCQAQKKQPPGCPPHPKSASQPHLNPNPTWNPNRPQPIMRDGPTCSYPTLGSHNRIAMAGWYIANMDAMLSNLMRLFEIIYRDTLRMCGIGACDLRELRNALPDPTLLSMQQRTSGHWRPNFMNCKIDFLLHIAAMVYRNTQDLKCGCPCSLPADTCGDGKQLQSPPPVQNSNCMQVSQGWPTGGGATQAAPPDTAMTNRHKCCRFCGANRNNAAAASQGYCASNCFDHQQHPAVQIPDQDSSEESESTPQPRIIAPCRAAAAADTAIAQSSNASRLRSRVQRRRRQSNSPTSSYPAAGSRSRQPDKNSNNADYRGDSADRKLQKRVKRVMALLSKTYTRVRSSSTSRGGGSVSSDGETDTGNTCLSVDIKIPK